MSNKKVPNAWDDDDWEAQADKVAQEEDRQEPAAQAPKSKAERLAAHREINRKLWQEAEEPPALPYHVAATSSVPFASGFKTPIQVLSRKPVAKTIDPVTGLEKLTVEDDDDEAEKPPQPTAAELEEQRKRELEKKNRDYEERRAKLFGTTPAVETTSGTSTPGATTPPLVGEGGGGGRGNHRGGRGGRGGRGRGGRGGQRNNNNDSYRSDRSERNDRNDRSDTKNDGQDARRVGNNGSPYRELFDPEAASRPSSTRPQRASGTSSPAQGPESAIRNPRGPDSTGRGGFGFANHGAKEGRP